MAGEEVDDALVDLVAVNLARKFELGLAVAVESEGLASSSSEDQHGRLKGKVSSQGFEVGERAFRAADALLVNEDLDLRHEVRRPADNDDWPGLGQKVARDPWSGEGKKLLGTTRQNEA